MIPAFEVTDTLLADLASGAGGAGAIADLWRGQRSRRLLLLRVLHDRLGPGSDRDAAYAAIVTAEREAPEATRSLLTEPMVGLWAAGTVRSILSRSVSRAQLGQLAALAVSASLRAGTAARLSGYAPNGWLSLPALGRLRVAPDTTEVRVHTAGGRLFVDGAERPLEGPDWHHRRTLTLPDGVAVHVEDVDPHRDVFHVRAADRLPPADLDVWQHLLAETWQILTRYAPQRITELRAGLHSLVPLRKPSAAAAHSATARDAVGVIGLDLPPDAAEFAVALVHEFQHSKLTALLDLVPLHLPSDRLFFAPWRTDPRPIGGLLQGVYAFLAVAATWRALATDPARFPHAERQFAEARAQVSDAVRTLAHSGLLTPAGQRFAAGVQQAADGLSETGVPAAVEAAAGRSLALRRSTWDQAHLPTAAPA